MTGKAYGAARKHPDRKPRGLYNGTAVLTESEDVAAKHVKIVARAEAIVTTRSTSPIEERGLHGERFAELRIRCRGRGEQFADFAFRIASQFRRELIERNEDVDMHAGADFDRDPRELRGRGRPGRRRGR